MTHPEDPEVSLASQGSFSLTGSFRDPAGHVFQKDGRVFRTVNPVAAADFEFVRGTKFYERAIHEGKLVEAALVDREALGAEAGPARYVLEHPKLPFISYPYEWPFPALKAAALFHLDFHLQALEEGVTLSDASAYNVQFIGARPIFMDTLSLCRYKDGELWAGHRQFCEQFLNPLLLRSLLGLAHNAWYRGTQEGISARELRKLLPFRRKLSRHVLTHVILQDFFQKTAGRDKSVSSGVLNEAGLPLRSFQKILTSLRKWVSRLQPADAAPTAWQDYAKSHSYRPEEVVRKRRFVAEFAGQGRLRQVWDIGCNTGDYAVSALEGGAEYVIGFDYDQGALELAFARAQEDRLRFLPLFLDVANPPPSQGWAQRERQGLQERACADGLIALALIHHLAIARNVPLPQAVQWLVGLAPRGVIEFVPKEDPMVQELLKLRRDIFPDYTQENFLACVRSLARVERTESSSSTGRLLVQFSRN